MTTALLVVVGNDGIVAFDDVGPAISEAAARVRSGGAAGVHVGTPRRHESGYLRRDALVASAIAKLAQPGQALVSEAAAAQAGDLADGVSLREAGSHDLPGLGERLALWRVAGPGLSEEPVRAAAPVDRTLGRLPALLTPTVGRDGELAELAAMLTDPTCRLVTLTGPGGTGKTRLATELAARVADRYPDGVRFVPLATVTRADEVWVAIAQVLDLPADGQIPPGLFDYVADKQLLLVLDNLEQISEAGTVVAELLANARHITVLATSRKVLRVAGEHQHEVPPLELPDTNSSDAVAASGAVQLFVETAQRVNQQFRLTEENAADIAALCAALDGLPLAIELAAVRSRLLTPKALLDRLDTALDLAAKNTDQADRQRTLRETIDWSYRLLQPNQQLLLRKVAVFAGGASYPALDAVAGSLLDQADLLDVLDDLLDASLLKADTTTPETRFTLLETIRRYALDATTREELHASRTAHTQYFYDLLSILRPDASRSPGRMGAWLHPDRANLAEVVRRGASGVTDPAVDGDVPPRHVLALFVFTANAVGWYPDVLAWLDLADSLAFEHDTLGALACDSLRIAALESAGRLDEAVQLALEVTEASKTLAAADATSPLPWMKPVRSARFALYKGGWSACRLGRIDDARALLERMRELPPPEKGSTEDELLAGLSNALAGVLGDHNESLRGELLGLDDARRNGRTHDAIAHIINIADSLAELGDRRGAWAQLRACTPDEFAALTPQGLEAYGTNLAVAIGMDHPLMAARMVGALDTYRAVQNRPYTPEFREWTEAFLADPRRLVSQEEWDRAVERGHGEDLTDLISEVAGLPVET